MIDPKVEILLVEDNPNDLQLAMHAFKKSHLTTSSMSPRRGRGPGIYLLHRGPSHSSDRGRSEVDPPGSEAAAGRRVGSPQTGQGRPSHAIDSGRDHDLFARRTRHRGTLSTRREQLYREARGFRTDSRTPCGSWASIGCSSISHPRVVRLGHLLQDHSKLAGHGNRGGVLAASTSP